MKFDAKRLLRPLNIVYLVIAVLSLVSLIFYSVNISAEGYYQAMKVDGMVGLSILVIVLALIPVVCDFLKFDGVVGKIVTVVSMACKVVAPCLLCMLAIKFVGTRVSGLGYIFFSNDDVKKEVATSANVSSAVVAIITTVLYVVTGITGVVAAFIAPKED